MCFDESDDDADAGAADGSELKDDGDSATAAEGSWVVGKRWKVDPDSAAPLCGWYAPPPWALTTQQIASARRSAGLVSV